MSYATRYAPEIPIYRWGRYSVAAGAVAPLDHPAVPPPGPDFLAEARRVSRAEPFDAEARADYLMGCVVSDGEPPHPDLDAAWVKKAVSKAEKTRATARNKLVKLLKADHEAREYARISGDLLELYRYALYSPGFALPVMVKSRQVHAVFVPGSSFDPGDDRPGPRPATVMVVGKHPGSDEVAAGRNLVGAGSLELLDMIRRAGLEEASKSWYVTNLVKHTNIDPSSDAMPVGWAKNCAPLLHTELLICRPDFVLCLGADAAKQLLGEKKLGVAASRNHVFELEIPAFGDAPAKVAKLMLMAHPAVAAHDPLAIHDVREGFEAFAKVLRGEPRARPAIVNRRHVVVYKEDRLRDVVDEILARTDGNVLAMDCEWHGEWWQPEGYLLTVQFSARAGEAFVVRLRSQGGVPAFHPSEEAAFSQLRRLCKSTPERHVRVGGHFFRADLPWLVEKAKLDLRPEFAAPRTPEETRTKGGFDTAYMLHSIFEDRGPFGLEEWAVKLLGVHRYDEPIDREIERYCKAEKGRKKSALGGYGMIPDAVLDPYAAMDADVVREMFDVLNGARGLPGLLDRDRYGLDSRAPFRTSQGAQLGFLEMEMTGMLVDRGRVDALVMAFTEAANRELRELQAAVGWEDAIEEDGKGRPVKVPGFNPQSAFQVREILFGEEYSGKGVDAATGRPVRLRPPGVPTMGLTPIKTTGKRSKQWARVVQDEDDDIYSPATDAETMGILGIDCEVANRIRRTKFLQKMLQNPLNPYAVGDDGAALLDGSGFRAYRGGFMKFLCPDGRVRTRFFPVETGRYSSSKPNLQNWSTRREEEYKRLLGPSYLYPLRSCFMAPPGWVIVKTDLKSAELLAVARQANDPQMIADVSLAMLPASDPRYVDQHSAAAVAAFKLDCAPTKAAMQEAGKSALRTAAKNQKFGALYGRGIDALVRQCREEHVDVTREEMEAIQRAFEDRCPFVQDYLDGAAYRSQEPGHLTTALGRHRRSAPSSNMSARGNAERSFKNFPIQGLVADVVSTAMESLYWEREAHRSAGGEHDFRFMLQLHDELDFLVPIPWFVPLLKGCIEGVEVPVADFDGAPIPNVPTFHFECDVSIYLHWGEKIDPAEAEALGIDLSAAEDD